MVRPVLAAVIALASLIVPARASGLAEADRAEESNCEAVQAIIRVPPSNVRPLVPAEFTLDEIDGKVGLAIGANRCDEVRLYSGDRLVSALPTIFTTLRVGIKEPEWDVVDGVELFHNYQFWIATDNPDLVRFFRRKGGNNAHQAVHVEGLQFALTPDGTFSFDVPSSAPSPFHIDANADAVDSVRLLLTDAFWAAVSGGVMKESAHQDQIQLGHVKGVVEPAADSELARIMCGASGAFEGDANGAITGDPDRGSVHTFFPSGGYTLDVRAPQASPTARASCTAIDR